MTLEVGQTGVFCPWCRRLVAPIETGGHTQCPLCTQVIESCCGG